MSRLAACLAVAGLFFLTPRSHAEQEWGTVKGQVTWAPAALPIPVAFAAPPGTPICVNVKAGNIQLEPYVVDPKTKGLRWVVVWLLDPSGDCNKEIPVHPTLKAVPAAKVVLDQPCCTFDPPVLCVREGQTVTAKNSAAFAHNVNIPELTWNPLVPAGASVDLPALTATKLPLKVSCSIHPWMNGRVGVFKNPYFAVTDADGRFEIKDAPAGKFLLVVWHDEGGFVNEVRLKNGKIRGEPIDIKPDAVTEVKFAFTPKP